MRYLKKRDSLQVPTKDEKEESYYPNHAWIPKLVFMN